MVELKEEKDSEAVESTKDSTWVISGKGKDTKLGARARKLIRRASSVGQLKRKNLQIGHEKHLVCLLSGQLGDRIHLCSLETLKPKLPLEVVERWSTAEQTPIQTGRTHFKSTPQTIFIN